MKKKILFILLSICLGMSVLIVGACGTHTHTYSNEWSYDETYHWHSATCEHTEEKTEYAEHTWNGGEITKQATKEEEGEKTFTCVVCQKQKKETIPKIPKDELIFKTLKFTFNSEHNYYETSLTLRNGTETYNFEEEITCSGTARYSLMVEDEGGKVIGVSGKTVDLPRHDMVFYVNSVNQDSGDFTYKINFHVNNLYEVNFLDKEDKTFLTQNIEEGYTASVPETSPTAQGYDFANWDFDFETPILKDTEISSVFTPRNDTPYKVKFYHQSKDGDYTNNNNNTWNLTGTTDETVTVDIDKYMEEALLTQTHHLNAEKSQVEGTVSAKGDTVLEVYFDINVYKITNKNPEFAEISVEGSESLEFPWQTWVTLNITYYKACHFVILQSDDKMLVKTPITEQTPDPTSFFIAVQDNITVEFEKEDDLKDFNTVHTKDSVKVTGYIGKGGAVVVPESVHEVGSQALGKNDIITSLEFKYNSVIFDDWAMGQATALESVILPKTLYKMSMYMFNECTALKSITIPNSVEELDNTVFNGCTALEHITFGSGLKEIGPGAFTSCTALKELILPNSCKDISQIFVGLMSVEKIVMPAQVNDFSQIFVRNCPKLKSIVFPENMTVFKGYIIQECPKLEYIVVSDKIVTCGYQNIRDVENNLDIFYHGTSAQFSQITQQLPACGYIFGPCGNTVYFYSETTPTVSGNYWHYENGLPVKW